MTIKQPVGTSNSSVSIALERLQALRALGGAVLTKGLPDEVVERFLGKDADLVVAVDRAWEKAEELRDSQPELLAADERVQIDTLQAALVNFYGRELVNPYVGLGAAGPWIVTAKGAVLHDSGGYGMLGLGHAP